jgi:F-type H+-transporting ATPase subunit epsilon
MADTFKLEVITPYRVFYSGEADMDIAKSIDGDLGILAHHEPMVASTDIGECKILIGGKWKAAAMSDGFMEIEDNCVTILVGAAEWPEEIDVTRAERSKKRAEERLGDTTVSWETKRVARALKRAEVRLAIASRAAAETETAES